eukprot:gene17891-biopygen22177
MQDGEVSLLGYRPPIRSDRDPEKCRKKKGGGVAVYVREDISVEKIMQEAGEDFELAAFTTEDDTRYAAVYRTPGHDISENALDNIEKAMAASSRC